MTLWDSFIYCIFQLRGAFSRKTTFLWFGLTISAMVIRSDQLGVTSFIRSANISPRLYHALLHFFHSTAIKKDVLLRLWIEFIFKVFQPYQVDGYYVCIADGIKKSKEGKKMPAVRCLHQESANNSKSEYIMGHSYQVISLLVANKSGFYFAVPILSKLCEGIIFCSKKTTTLLEKLSVMMLQIAQHALGKLILVADAYYASQNVISPLFDNGHHLISRMKSNGVGYKQATNKRKSKRGRKKLYGDSVKLKNLFRVKSKFIAAPSPVYDEEGVEIEYRVVDLLWKPTRKMTRFVLVMHPTRGNIILLSTSLELDALTIIKLYGLRFKIEVWVFLHKGIIFPVE